MVLTQNERCSHQYWGNSSRGFVDIRRKSPLWGVRFANRLACQGHALEPAVKTFVKFEGGCSKVGMCCPTSWSNHSSDGPTQP
ncbi:hypothetical protein PCASD_04987 [Puccinia coronata f. sp. avenae]|uniref:Uncharacterized protein n=1 Tax=Puccinia coronata f. sp. avenae TaxID=200324 RepID=A0A2N5UNK7_9BASI|nr:hypothetical protein PCASD_04987 [Puccinia coronata f. sp. avenae]